MKKALIRCLLQPKCRNKLKAVDAILKKWCFLYRPVRYRLRTYLRKVVYKCNQKKDNELVADIWQSTVVSKSSNVLNVSIIVPNYNHELYLEERLQSIYAQTYKNYEVILLDDCSTDQSTNILKKYAEQYRGNTQLYINSKGSGSAFKQWRKGISLAKGDLIWIAESDDFCDEDFLGKLIPYFKDEAVMLAFSRSTFVEEGREIYTTEEYLQEIKQINWGHPFVMTGNKIVEKGFALKNIVPNVSSAVFKNIKEIPLEIEGLWSELKLCGDWIFYLSLLKGGVLAYTNETTNYYRIHKKSTSLKIQNTSEYYREFEVVAKYIMRNYSVDMRILQEQKEILKKHYQCFHPDESLENIDKLYDLEEIYRDREKKLPNVIVCGFSMIMGGGETFPIILANGLKEYGVSVTFFDFNMAGYDENVRKMLRADIPLVDVKSLNNIGMSIEQLGADVIHSHHASVDDIVSVILQSMQNRMVKQIITLHGMYESIDKNDLEDVLKNVSKTCAKFVYTAQKNLDVFKNRSDINYREFAHIRNGLKKTPINPINRKELNIKDDAFVLCLVSRAIPEKGWAEAVEVVCLAREKSGVDIQLILIGKGEMYDKLLRANVSFVHLLGEKNNIRDYFACSDMGFLPSRFRGESYPLVIIDCLFAGTPVIASNIGEIQAQLSTKTGDLAGMVFDLYNDEIPIKYVSEELIQVIRDRNLYDKLKMNIKEATEKFYIENVVTSYMEEYKKIK